HDEQSPVPLDSLGRRYLATEHDLGTEQGAAQDGRQPAVAPPAAPLHGADRRAFLRQAVAAGLSSAAAYALLGQASARAQDVTTFAVGEETTSPPRRQPRPPSAD